MSKENINKIQSLLNNAKATGTYWESYEEKKSRPNCDKHGAGFQGDERFSVFACKVSFSAHTGNYGNSSCSSFCNGMDRDVANKYLIGAMNVLKETLFKEMSKAMQRDALALKGKAVKEVEQLQEMINSIEGD